MTNFTRRSFTSALALGVAAPAFLRNASAQSATIKIGQVIPITGPAAEAGKYAKAGAEIALAEINKKGGILGKQVEIITEDDQTTNPGAVLSFSDYNCLTFIILLSRRFIKLLPFCMILILTLCLL